MTESESTAAVVNQDHRFKYDQETISRILNLKVGGRSYQELSFEFKIPVTTLYCWRDREKKNSTDLGKRLCSSTVHRQRKDKSRTVEFPGGSVYTEGENGRAIIQEQKQEEEVSASSKSEEALSDEILGEVALRLGRREIEIISLKARLVRKR